MKNKNIFKLNIIYFIAITLVAVVFLLAYLGILQNDILLSFLIQVVVMFAVPLLMYSIFMKKDLKESFSDCGFKSISTKMLLISIALGFVLYFVNSYIADMFYGILAMFGYESLPTVATTTADYSTLLQEFVLSCILPGFCEEFVHRGIMLNAYKKHTNPRFCLIISSILFGLTHLNIGQFFYATILGFLMGVVSLASNSIFPAMIIHFMNNFLSNYFFYGTHFNWPLAKFLIFVKTLFSSDVFIFILTSSTMIILLIVAYYYLVRSMIKERAKNDVRVIVKELKMDKISLIQAQTKLNHVNSILKHKFTLNNKKTKFSFTENIFLISSLILGVLITVSSFIWGVI